MLLLKRRRRQYGYYHGDDNSNRYRDLESNHLDNRIDDKEDCNKYEVARNCYFFLILSALSSKMKGVLKYMSEAVISRRGGSGSGEGGSKGYILASDLITTNTEYTVPNHIGNLSVRIFGGGGGTVIFTHPSSTGIYGYVGGSGSGWMNNGEFDIANETSIPITIGSAGSTYAATINQGSTKGGNGGTTSFCTYLSANGGESGTSNWTGRGYRGDGGNGGAGGGAVCSESNQYNYYCNGGRGYQFGGGGAAHMKETGQTGNQPRPPMALGGQWGGNGGGYPNSNGNNGINTFNIESEPFKQVSHGGMTTNYQRGYLGYGGGGGYGCNGGVAGVLNVSSFYGCGGGSGGGYFSDGGNFNIDSYSYIYSVHGGHGSGYGGSYGGGMQNGICIIQYYIPREG